ncbi:alpha/beta fold hydrolase [Streptomyces sp. SID8379]|uniref:alpha/beta hydrolase n=1 Tax=unclassified Streptomyces TaxID=2593676 RepID=UPI00039DA0ED|nr:MULTISPECIES: alpha/beta hydrolase [unclassified Streptomyces]MYW64102.1 alpha/beta fold hydrolase [Streptomyces sp. SID8379]
MRHATRATSALYAAAGSLVLSTLVAAPAGSASATPSPTTLSPGTVPETLGSALAAGRAAAAGIDWKACPAVEDLPESVRCGTVTVPLDYARPDGRQIRLTVSRIAARGKKSERQGSFVFNPGGPGGNGMYFPLVGMMPEWKRIGAAYDLVGYAPRGVGRSAPISCQDPKQFAKAPTQSPTHPSASYKMERIAQAKSYAAGCAKNLGIAHYTSLNNARDLDVLRAALGERKLTYMGASYGTYIGAVYAQLFPSHVRRMVFDSAVNPDPQQIWYTNNLEQSAAFERRWADFRAWVAKHDKTYGLGTTPEEVLRSYEKVRAELAHEPAGKKVGPGQLQSAYLQAGYYDDYWPMRALALSEYLKGNPKPLIGQAAPPSEGLAENENGNAVYTAVECNDAPWPTDFRVWDHDNTALAKTAPFETWDNAWMNLPCAYWSAPRQRPVDVRVGPGRLPSTLILAAERDAATPYTGARELNRRLAGSVLVTEKNAGTHGIGGGANACVNGHLDAYVLEGRVPEERSATCAAHAEPTPLR